MAVSHCRMLKQRSVHAAQKRTPVDITLSLIRLWSGRGSTGVLGSGLLAHPVSKEVGARAPCAVLLHAHLIATVV